MKDASLLEEAALTMLFTGEADVLVRLRAQSLAGRVVSRHFTGVGFFTKFEIPKHAPSVGRDFSGWGDVFAAIPALRHGASFIVFGRDGYLTTLEGFTYDEPWPEDTSGYVLKCEPHNFFGPAERG